MGGLKSYLGQVVGMFSLWRIGRALKRWLIGNRGTGGGAMGSGNWAEEWDWKIGKASGGPRDQSLARPPQQPQRPSSKPLLLFLLSSIGLPWLMTKLVRLLTRLQEERQRAEALAQGTAMQVNGNGNGQPGMQGPITFARALHPFQASESHELSLKRDEIVAILQRYEGGAEGAGGREMGWWRGRTRDGRMGWFPGNYVSSFHLVGSVTLLNCRLNRRH